MFLYCSKTSFATITFPISTSNIATLNITPFMLRVAMLLVVIMVINATFNKISVIFWRSVLLGEETRILVENHRPAASHQQTL
jgi:hypothetical protein